MRLLLDLETAPMLAYTWGTYKQTIPYKMVKQPWRMLCWAAKDIDTKKTYGSSLHLHDGYSEKDMLQALAELLDKADVVIAHNGIKFDVRKINARFVSLGIRRPSPYRIYDTLRVARRHFAFTSNRLADLPDQLGIKCRKGSPGWDTWEGCLAGDVKSFEKLYKYCKQDVKVLEEVFRKLLPWQPLETFGIRDGACPTCNGTKLHSRGLYVGSTETYTKYSCTDCGSWSRGTGVKHPKRPKKLKALK